MSVVVALEDGLPDVSGVDRWIYAGRDAAWRIAAEHGSLAGVPRVEIADLLQRKAEELRRPFLEWVGELGRRNDSLEWWGSQLAARTSYTRFFERVCTLAAVREALADQPGTTLVVCATQALAEEVARAAGAEGPSPTPPAARPRHVGRSALRAWVRLMPRPLHGLPARVSDDARLSLDNDPRYRRAVLARHGPAGRSPFGGPATALLFTWIDERSFRPDGGYTDPHLGPLAGLLRERGVEVAYVARVLHTLSFADAVSRLGATGETFLFPDTYLKLDDYRECTRRAAAFSPSIPPEAEVAGVPVSALAREHVEGERAGLADSLVVERLVRRLADAGIRPERVVHTYEGHDWELVLAWAVRRHLPRTAVIGYENLNMSRLALSMYPAKSELGVRPLPDWIVTNGPAYRDVLVAEGLPEQRVRVGCGLRHEALWRIAPRAPRGRPDGEPFRVLAATELALAPTLEFLDKALGAFADDPGFELVVKCHPLLWRSELLRLLGDRAAAIDFDDRPVLGQLGEADMLLYTYTAVGIEALALGVPPLFVRSESALDLDQLEFARDLRWEARTPDELRETARTIAALDDAAAAEWRRRARAAAERALAPVRPECVEAFL